MKKGALLHVCFLAMGVALSIAVVISRASANDSLLASTRQMLVDVEHSPSANLEILRAKLMEARRMTEAALKFDINNQEAKQLQRRIDDLLAELAPKMHSSYPSSEEAWSTLDRLIALVKGGAPFGEIESTRTKLEQLVMKLELESPEEALDIRQQLHDLHDLTGFHR